MAESIFFTGATGFLGSNLVRRFLRNGYVIHCLIRENSNTSIFNDIYSELVWVSDVDVDYESYFRIHNIDYIFHCATEYGRNQDNLVRLIDANFLLPTKLIYSASKTGVKGFVNMDTMLARNVNPYSLSKNQFVDWLIFFSKNMSCFNIRLEHFYGPGDSENKFIGMLINNLLNSELSIDLTEGLQKRDFIYIDDVVEALDTIFKNAKNFKNGFHEYEVGSGELISIRELVIKIQKKIGNNQTVLNFGKILLNSTELFREPANILKLKKMGWTPKINLDDGLAKAIAFEKNKRCQ